MDKNNPDKKKRQPPNLLRYSGMATQMIAIILLGVFLGSKLDTYYLTEKPYWAGGLAFAGVIIGLYLSLKNLIGK